MTNIEQNALDSYSEKKEKYHRLKYPLSFNILTTCLHFKTHIKMTEFLHEIGKHDLGILILFKLW